jgi:hypothetical protein
MRSKSNLVANPPIKGAGMSLAGRCLRVLLVAGLGASMATAQGKKGSTPAPSGGSNSSSPAPASPSSSAAFESQMLAYGALDHIASRIATTVCDSEGITETPAIVIFDQASFAALQSYEAFVANANVVIGAYRTLLDADSAEANKLTGELKNLFHNREQTYQLQSKDTNGTSALENEHLSESWKNKEFALTVTGPAIGDPFSDLTGLLSAIAISSNTETAGAITIPDSALAVLLTRKLASDEGCSGKAIVYPPLFGHGSASDFSSQDIQADIQEVDDVRRQVHQHVHDANVAFIDGHKTQTGITGDTVLTAALTDVDGLYDNFMNSLLQVNSASGVLGSAAVIQGYQLKSLLAGHKKVDGVPVDANHAASPAVPAVPPAYVLLATIVASGGTERVHKTFWTALSSGDKITYSGGAIVNVSLWKANAKSPVYSQELRYRTPFMDLRPPADSHGVDLGDNLEDLDRGRKKFKGD